MLGRAQRGDDLLVDEHAARDGAFHLDHEVERRRPRARRAARRPAPRAYGRRDSARRRARRDREQRLQVVGSRTPPAHRSASVVPPSCAPSTSGSWTAGGPARRCTNAPSGSASGEAHTADETSERERRDRRATSSGRSICGRCPVSGSNTRRPSGSAPASSAPPARRPGRPRPRSRPSACVSRSIRSSRPACTISIPAGPLAAARARAAHQRRARRARRSASGSCTSRESAARRSRRRDQQQRLGQPRRLAAEAVQRRPPPRRPHGAGGHEPGRRDQHEPRAPAAAARAA